MTVPAMFSPFFIILAKGKSALQPFFDFPDFDLFADFTYHCMAATARSWRRK